MAQWDVYPNPSAQSRSDIPYLVDLQSDLLASLGSRLVAPLARSRVPVDGLPRRLCPRFTIEGETLMLMPQEAGPVGARRLKDPVLSLRHRAHEITDALDAVLSGC